MPSIEVLIKKVDQLPSIPAIIKRLIDLTADPETDIKDILELIQKDQALTAGVLRLCNSAYYGLSRRVASIDEAVIMLGFNTIANICLTIGPALYFRRNLWIYGRTGADLWRHSVATAFSCEQLSHYLGEDRIEVTYTAGLLHDIGKLVLAEHDPRDLKSIMELAAGDMELVEAEKKVVGLDHGAIGAKLAARWKFPRPLVQAIKYHHRPSRAPSDADLCEIVYIGNTIAHQLEKGTRIDMPDGSDGRVVFDRYGIGSDQLDRILSTVNSQVEDAEASLKEIGTVREYRF
jgi:putative nucleotidyltransferase with HDIG domain